MVMLFSFKLYVWTCVFDNFRIGNVGKMVWSKPTIWIDNLCWDSIKNRQSKLGHRCCQRVVHWTKIIWFMVLPLHHLYCPIIHQIKLGKFISIFFKNWIFMNCLLDITYAMVYNYHCIFAIRILLFISYFKIYLF